MIESASQVTDHIYEQRLRNAAQNLNLVLPDRACKHLLQFLSLMGRWNETYNLTAIRNPSDQLTQHVFDSLAVAPYLNSILNDSSCTVDPAAPDLTFQSALNAQRVKGLSEHRPVLTVGTEPSAQADLSLPPDLTRARPGSRKTQQIWDVGSGAGLPGLVFAILWPERQITTVDSVGKKIAFQKHVISELGLNNVTAQHGRLEVQTALQPPNLIVCRAFTSLIQFANACQTIAGPDTTLAAMKGKLPEKEMQELETQQLKTPEQKKKKQPLQESAAPWQIQRVQPVKVPELDAERHLIIMNRN